MKFDADAPIWLSKQRILCTLNHSLKDVLNYGLFQPAYNGKAGKFLDEERQLKEYPLPSATPVPYLEVGLPPLSLTYSFYVCLMVRISMCCLWMYVCLCVCAWVCVLECMFSLLLLSWYCYHMPFPMRDETLGAGYHLSIIQLSTLFCELDMCAYVCERDSAEIVTLWQQCSQLPDVISNSSL